MMTISDWFESTCKNSSRPRGPRVEVWHRWKYVPVGRRGEVIDQAGDLVRIHLDEPLRGLSYPSWTIYTVHVHVSCIRQLSPLEHLAEAAG
jgi:hypothetical protein